MSAAASPTRPGMLPNPTCYGCLGTGYHVGFGSRPFTPCLHHAPTCDPADTHCHAPCEWADDYDPDTATASWMADAAARAEADAVAHGFELEGGF